MGKAISLLRPPQPPREGARESGMELRQHPRPRLLDPDFVSSPPPELLRKRARKQAPAKRPREAAAAAKWQPPLKRSRCAWRGVGSPVARLHPVVCHRQRQPLPPRTSRRGYYPRPCHQFNWYEPDMWTEVAKHLHGYDLVRLCLTCRWFRRLLADDSIWRYAFLRDLCLPTVVPHLPRPLRCSWRFLYSASFDRSHAYCFRQPEKHLDWVRIGGFMLESPRALLTSELALPRWLPPGPEDMRVGIEMAGACLLTNARPGIWIADFHLVRCPVCNFLNCQGTMQVLDTRHCEVFLEESYVDGTWEYEDLGHHFIDGQAHNATGAIFNDNRAACSSAAFVLNARSWIGRHGDLLPKACLATHAAAISTNLQPNNGLLVRFKAIRDMNRDGQIVCIRITHQIV
ncbi:hypothetical protein ACP70R_030700 [Stipagrostis hirtigluma subsp. patula]